MQDFMRRLEANPAAFAEFKASIAEALAEFASTGGTPLDFDEIRRKAREYAATRGHRFSSED
jgi:hypothetical protein